MIGFGIFCGFFMKTMRIILAISKTSSLNGLYGLQHCSSVTNDWKSQQWVIVGLRVQLTITKMPFSVMELLVTGELWLFEKNFTKRMVTGELWLFEKKSTKRILHKTALQVWYVFKTMLIIWASLFPKHFLKIQINATIVADIYIWVARQLCLFLFVFYALFFSRILKKTQELKKQNLQKSSNLKQLHEFFRQGFPPQSLGCHHILK